MDFALNEEQIMARDMVRELARDKIYPTLKEWDRRHQPHPDVLPLLAENGVLGINIPVRYGGQGFDYITLALACEELERIDASLRVIMSVHAGLNSLALLQWATEEQKQRFLVPQARGEKVAGYGLTEAEAGSDPVNLRSTARREGDVYILNGEKMWISLATLADHFIVFAKTDPHAEPRHKGITAFIITRDMKGVSTYDEKHKLGVRAGSTGGIVMQDVEVPLENRLGEEGEGFYIAMSCLDNGRYTVAAGATGCIRACLEDSVKYAKERHTFGVPIAQHQLIKQKLAFMQQWYDAAWLLVMRAGWLKNQGQRNTRETAVAKWFATDMSVKAALEAVQLHGAYGFSDEYDVERYLRNAKGAVIYEGSSEIQQLIQADYALGYRHDRPLRCEPVPYDAATWQSEG
ncbi:MAG: acyl-CoA dehydrogenase family protein [Chloroflexota bacterium]|jgi:alkylation response protein AidB-like acyl-CoA dehydrogenase